MGADHALCLAAAHRQPGDRAGFRGRLDPQGLLDEGTMSFISSETKRSFSAALAATA